MITVHELLKFLSFRSKMCPEKSSTPKACKVNLEVVDLESVENETIVDRVYVQDKIRYLIVSEVQLIFGAFDLSSGCQIFKTFIRSTTLSNDIEYSYLAS